MCQSILTVVLPAVVVWRWRRRWWLLPKLDGVVGVFCILSSPFPGANLLPPPSPPPPPLRRFPYRQPDTPPLTMHSSEIQATFSSWAKKNYYYPHEAIKKGKSIGWGLQDKGAACCCYKTSPPYNNNRPGAWRP